MPWSHKWSYLHRAHFCVSSSSLPGIFINSLALGAQQIPGWSATPGGGKHSHIPLAWRPSAPIQSPAKMCCSVLSAGRWSLGMATSPLCASCWLFLKIWCGKCCRDKSIQRLKHIECPQGQTDRTHRAAWTNLEPAESRDVNKSGNWSTANTKWKAKKQGSERFN